MADPRAGQPAEPSDLVDLPRLLTSYYALHPDPERPGPAGLVRDLRASWLVVPRRLQRGPHRRDQPGDRRVPGVAGHRRAAVPREGHARAVRAGLRDGAGGVRRERCARPRRQPRRLHAHAVAEPRHPRGQPGEACGNGGRRRRHALAQPAVRRRLQVQPARRRPRRQRHHEADPGPGQRVAPLRPRRRPAHPLRPGAGRRTRPGRTTSSPPTSRTSPRCSTSTRSARPVSASGPIRSAVRPSPTGERSPSGTGST